MGRHRRAVHVVAFWSSASYRATGSSSSLYTDSVNAAKSLCQELPKLLESILEASSPACPVSALIANVHVRYVLLIE